jgi:phosphatidylserine/phosphatidylglycerophosphate/cardiolipin synthase-like enzyme
MRARKEGPLLKLRAIAGSHVVTLAWDFVAQAAIPDDLLGFAIERTEKNGQGEVAERYWLRGVKRFKFKDEGLPPGSPVPTSEHPVQSFQWGDYTARPGVEYAYRVVPVVGKPKLLDLAEDKATMVEVTTESEEAPAQEMAGNAIRHDVWFNRGVAGSQAYARKFGKQRPDEKDPLSEQMAWLSRGLFEALVSFIGRASGADAADYKLRAMLYEFHYAPVGEAFKKAAEAGADVAIRYEAQSYKDVNEEMIQQVGIGDICTAQKVRNGIRHNKFIVLLHRDKPVAVWTGSTNISAGGIFGHSNVGHAIWDSGIAQEYLKYWGELASAEVTTGKLRQFCQQATPAPVDIPPPTGVRLLFSPRDPQDSQTTSRTLQWYADLLASATSIACMTFAFNFDDVFAKAVAGDTDALTYLVFDKNIDQLQETEVRQNKNAVIAAGAKLEKGDLENFLGETLTGFNRNRYIHDKFLLVDPLSDDPVVVTGTANFSEPSQESNDENMVVIRGDARVADIYFGEFMRIFDHHYVRYILAKLRVGGAQDPEAGYLKERRDDWLQANLKPGPKAKRREAFMA